MHYALSIMHYELCIINSQFTNVRMKCVEVGQTHVVAIFQGEHAMSVVWHGEHAAFELHFGERQNVLHIARVMVGNAQSVSLVGL